MKKLKLYLETSVWNFLFEEQGLEKRKWTEFLFDEYRNGRYELFISEVVAEEISRARSPRREQLDEAIRIWNPEVLHLGQEERRLSERYIEAHFIPERYIDDVNHLAIASVNEIDVLISWNLKHIVKLRTKTFVNSINMTEGYKFIEILTPQEVVDHDEGTESHEGDP